MSNAKEIYSEASKYYCETKVPSSSIDQERYNKSKAREAKFNENWKKEKVNIVDIVEKYAPNAKAYENGYVVEYLENGSRLFIDCVSSVEEAKEKIKIVVDRNITFED